MVGSPFKYEMDDSNKILIHQLPQDTTPGQRFTNDLSAKNISDLRIS